MRVAVVFGGSSGLGLAAAKSLKRDGYSVAVVARDSDKLANVTKQFGVLPLSYDLNNPNLVVDAIRETKEKLGHVSVLVINQGGPQQIPAIEAGVEHFTQAFNSLFLSAVVGIQTVLPDMIQKEWGRLILITSIAAKEPIDGLVLSNAIRAGLHGYAKTLSSEVAKHGITVNCIMPGDTKTKRLLELNMDLDQVRQTIPMGRLPTPDGLGNLVSFLASDRANFITGQSIAIDGGQTKSIF